MRKSVLPIVLVAFMLTTSFAMAAKRVNCCVKGHCHKLTEIKCDKMKGEVVKSCKECKHTSPYKPGRMKDYEKNPPRKGARGAFHMWDKEGNRAYHGMSTTDLHREIKQDIRRGKLPEGGKTTWHEAKPDATDEQIREQERRTIDKHQPPANLRGGGGGRPASSGQNND